MELVNGEGFAEADARRVHQFGVAQEDFGEGSDENNGCAGEALDAAGGFRAIHDAFEANVHHDKLGAEQFSNRDGIFAGGSGGDDLMADALQLVFEIGGDNLFVLDNQDP